MNRTGLDRLAILLVAAAFVAGGGCTKHMREERLLSKAGRDLEAGAYDKAELEYLSARRLAPFDPVAIRQLGILYFNEGRSLQAYPLLKRATELDPHDTAARLTYGEVLHALGEAKDARDAAKQVLKAEPANEEALLLLAETARSPPEEEEASQLVDQLRQSHADCAGYHLVLGRMMLVHRDADGAEKEFRSALALDPKSGTAHEFLASLYVFRGEAKQAAQEYRAAADLAPWRSPRRLQEIDFRARMGAAAEAKKELEDLIAHAPDYIPARVYGMRRAFAERRYADCAAAIKVILGRDPANYDAVMEQGTLKMARGDAAGAVADLKDAGRIYPRDPRIKFELALAYLRTGDILRAEDRLNEAINLAPTFSPAIVQLAELDVRQNNPVAAVALLEALLRDSPQLRDAYLILLKAYLVQKNSALAISTCARMAAAFPKDPEPYCRAGAILEQAGRKAEARKAFQQAIQRLPTYGPAYEGLVSLDLAEDRAEEASELVRTLTEKYPKASAPWIMRGNIDMAAHHPAAAEADLNKAIELDPANPRAYFALASVYLGTHQTEQALQRLTALVAKTKNTAAQMEIASIHESLAQYDRTAADLRVLLGMDPKFAPALNDLAYLDCEHLGNLDEAYDMAKRAREILPESAAVADTLGWILFKRGDYHGALDLLQESAGRSPDDLRIQYHLGMAHYMLAEEAPARLALERAASGRANSPEAAQARGRLAVLAIDPATAGEDIRADLERRVRSEPNDPVVKIRLAALLARTGSAAEAAAVYEAALKIAPQQPQILLPLAELYAGPLRAPDRARDLAGRAHELAPGDPRVSWTLGRLDYLSGDYKRSLALLREAARGLPSDPELGYDLTLSCCAAGLLPEAEAALRGALAGAGRFSRRPEAERLAEMLAAVKSPALAEAAAGDAGKILAGDPGCLPAEMVAALAAEHQGRAADASALYGKILAQDPQFAPAARQLARLCLQRTDQDDKAYRLALQAREAFPEDPAVATTLGIADYRRGDFMGAARLFQESLQRRADDPESYYYLGMSHYHLQRLAEGAGELQRSLDLKLAEPDSDSARQVLDEIKGQTNGPSLLSQPIK